MKRSDGHIMVMLLLTLLLMAGCGGERGPQALVLADSLMNSRPDSALAVLGIIL